MGWTKRAGIWICLSALFALGALEAVCGDPLPGLHAFPETTDEWLVRASGAFLALSAAAAFAQPHIGALPLALSWVWACVLAAIAALGSPTDLLGYVPVAEMAAFVAFALWRRDERRAWPVMRIVFGLMLILFGMIHLMHRETIASLIPEWIPHAAYWPWLTGGGSAVAGVACLIGRGVSIATGAVALMYASWLPLVHAPRLMADPANLFEWTFALTAVALAGVALATAGYASVTIAVSGRPPHSAQEPS